MAVRSGAGTGVIVTLVVFIVMSLGLLVLSIGFYQARVTAQQERDDAQDALSRFVRPQERQQDVFRRYEAAPRPGESVLAHMHGRIENLMRYLDGNPSSTLESVQSRLARFGIAQDGVVANSVQSIHNELRQSRDQVESLTTQLERASNELAQAHAQLENLRNSHRTELTAIQDQIAGYRQAADDYRDDVTGTRRALNEAIDRLNDRYENRVEELQTENDDFSRQIVVLEERIRELQDRLSADRLRPQDADTLVDGRIIEVSRVDDTVFINRGRNHRIVLGMTFEVFDDAASIRIDERGNLARGKASIQIVGVHDDTSSAKIIRSVPGRPVLRDNVIANAVYDPNHTFKFLIHGRFDLDGDSRATESEAEYIRTLVREWGGLVVTGETIPGDLDFLVLGVPPDEPPLLPDNPTPFQLEDWARKRQAQATYNQLLDEARRAQIPVLNHNRFLILIGHTHR